MACFSGILVVIGFVYHEERMLSYMRDTHRPSAHSTSDSAAMCQNLNQAEGVTFLSSLQKSILSTLKLLDKTLELLGNLL